MRWVGKRTYKGGRLEMGRFWLTWSGWRQFKPYRIGSTRVVSVGPLAVFILPQPTVPSVSVGSHTPRGDDEGSGE